MTSPPPTTTRVHERGMASVRRRGESHGRRVLLTPGPHHTADRSQPTSTRTGRVLASPRQERAARVLTGVYLFALVVTAAVWLIDRRLGRLALETMSEILNIPAAASLVSLVLLVLIVGALRRRKRVGLIVVVALQAVGALWSVLALARLLAGPQNEQTVDMVDDLGYGLVVGFEAVALLLGVVMAVAGWWLRPAFPSRVAPASWVRAAVVAAAGASLSLLLAVVVLDVEDSGSPTRSLFRVMGAAIRHAIGFRYPGDWTTLRGAGRPVSFLLEVLLSLTLLAAVYVVLRSTHSPARWDGDAEVQVRQLLAQHGHADSLGYFATRRDRSYAFSDDGRAVVSYRVVGSVCLASGDPLGARDAWGQAYARWLEVARTYGWVPAATSLGEGGARALAGQGFSLLTLGDEAVLRPARFVLDSTSMTPVRQAAGRARRAGLQVRVRRHAELSEQEMAEMIRLCDQWRLGGPERGFSMALDRLGDPADGRCVLVSAHHDDGTMAGLLSFVPWGRNGLSLDVMRRSPQAPNGVNELMIAETMSWAEENGAARVSLNFAVARSVFAGGEALGAGPLVRAGSSVLGVLDRFTQIESLYRNNEKFSPDWVPRYVAMFGAVSLLRVGLAIARAEGFLPSLRYRNPQAGKQLDDAQLEQVRRLSVLPQVMPDVGPRRSDQSQQRLKHLAALREVGRDPYAVGIRDARSVAELSVTELTVAELTDDVVDVGEGGNQAWRVHGRVRAIRRHGGVVFIDLIDNGVQRQVLAEQETLGREQVRFLGRNVDIGDVLVVEAANGLSRNGTPTLVLRDWAIAAKALQPVPYDGFEDPGERARRRCTDLIVRPRAGQLLRARSAAIQAVRNTLLEDGYREVETPILNSTHGGATARPFRTRSHAYSVDLVLRIAPELALKRLIVGGLGPIFEMGRNFRNEGADATHNPEFTSLEAYRPFADYTDMRLLTERLVRAAARAVNGAELIPLRDADGAVRLTDVSAPWRVVPVYEAVSQAVGQRVDQFTDIDLLLPLAREHGIHLRDEMGPGAIIEELYGDLVEPATELPTFYTDFPVETSPLTGPHRSEPGLVERWDLVIGRMELGTAYSELTDPLEQRRRLTEQSCKAAAGDPEAMEVDEDFLHALEMGMPPTGGLGVGLDRLVMLLTGTTIRDVLALPFVKPERP